MIRFAPIILILALILGCSIAERTANPLFPDPFYSDQGHTTITFTDLYACCTIEIYTLDGELVRTMIETDGDGQYVWDVKNRDGEELDSGLYNYRIIAPSEEKSGKLTIIR